MTCEACEKEFSGPSAMKEHLASSCLEKIIRCSQADNGCTWKGRKLSLEAHVDKCPYESIKGFFVIHNAKVVQLSRDNERMRRRASELEGTVRILRQELEWTKIALRPWFRPAYPERPSTTSGCIRYPSDEGANTRPPPSRVGPMPPWGMDSVAGGKIG